MANNSTVRGPQLNIVLPVAMVIVVLAAMCALPSWRVTRMRWLAEHHVLLTAAEDPLWTLPGDVAGLDLRRCILLFLAVVIALAYLFSWLWHLGRRVVQRRLAGGDRS